MGVNFKNKIKEFCMPSLRRKPPEASIHPNHMETFSGLRNSEKTKKKKNLIDKNYLFCLLKKHFYTGINLLIIK